MYVTWAHVYLCMWRVHKYTYVCDVCTCIPMYVSWAHVCLHICRCDWSIHIISSLFLYLYICTWRVHKFTSIRVYAFTCIRDVSIRTKTSSYVVCEWCTYTPVYLYMWRIHSYLIEDLFLSIHMYATCAHVYLDTWRIHTYHDVLLSIYICMWRVHMYTWIRDVSIRIMTFS